MAGRDAAGCQTKQRTCGNVSKLPFAMRYSTSQNTEYVKLLDYLSGGSIICCTQEAPDQESFKKSEKVLAGITCRPANSKARHCSNQCECVCKYHYKRIPGSLPLFMAVCTFLFVGKAACMLLFIATYTKLRDTDYYNAHFRSMFLS